MAERRGNLWTLLALGGLAMLVLLFALVILRGGGATDAAIRTAGDAIPDIRPSLPEPKLPHPPAPIPK